MKTAPPDQFPRDLVRPQRYKGVMPVFHANSEQETAAAAASLALAVQPGAIFTLQGPLGAGKSVFARGFIRALTGENTDVPSPTFTLVQTYETAKAPLWHFDLYRLQDPAEIYEIGWEEALAGGIVLVEWPERLGPLLPPYARRVEIGINTDTSRTIRVSDKSKR